MISGLDLNAAVDYIVKGDGDNPTVWRLGIIPSYLFARRSEEAQTKQIETVYKILQLAIKGSDNFTVPFSTNSEKVFGRDMQVVPIAVLEQIPLNVITELSMKVMEINKLTVDEAKN